MKRQLIALFFTLGTMFSCSSPNTDYFLSLDQAIELQAEFDREYTHIKDSLTALFRNAETDSAKWEAAFELEKILSYHDIDSCHHYINEMRSLHGNDQRQLYITEASYAHILYKMDSLQTALDVFRRIDRNRLSKSALKIYCDAGYHIYSGMVADAPEYREKRMEIIDYWWENDSTNIQCTFYHNEILREEGDSDKAIEMLESCVLHSHSDTAKANYFLAKEYLYRGNKSEAVKHFAISAAYDMRLSVKAYNSLYQLALILFREGDIERADRYMRITLNDAYASNFHSRYNDVIKAELEIMNLLLEQQQEKKRAYFTTIASIALALIIAVISLVLQRRYSTKLSMSREKLSEVSKIKDSFLAMYMERCVDYLNKVDNYRSSLRHAVKREGAQAAIAMLRAPSYADGAFKGLLADFDSAFLGIFPDFVDKVNEHMQPGHKLTIPQKGELSNELRVLALIRMGISKRSKIAKVLNMSVTTIYSYHSNLQKYSLHPDSSFDKIIAEL